MKLEQLGYKGIITELNDHSTTDGLVLGRVIVEHKERYITQTVSSTVSCEITGNMRYAAKSRADYPTVGDWVRLMTIDDQSAVIVELLPRQSVLERQAVGKHGEVQLIAANIDVAFIVQSVGHDFNLNRLERYMTICLSSGIEPLILLTKVDLITPDELQDLLKRARERLAEIRIIALSSKTKYGFDNLKNVMQPFKTYCFLGSSGVGKSTIVNELQGQEVLKTSEISKSTNKGRHTTSHRELFILPNGSIVIDTPGMREVGLANHSQGIESAYDHIGELSEHCKFNDCTHTNEVGCAVIQAVEEGELSLEAYNNYLKLKREQDYFSSTVQERRQKGKELGKMYKGIMQMKNKRKY